MKKRKKKSINTSLPDTDPEMMLLVCTYLHAALEAGPVSTPALSSPSSLLVTILVWTSCILTDFLKFRPFLESEPCIGS